MLETIENLSDNHIVLAGDFNFFFDTSPARYEGKPTLKKKSVAKFIELKEKFDLCDTWRIRNSMKKFISDTLSELFNENILDDQVK